MNTISPINSSATNKDTLEGETMPDIILIAGIGSAIVVLICCMIAIIIICRRKNKTKIKSTKSSSYNNKRKRNLETAINVSTHEYKPTITDTRDLDDDLDDDLDVSDATTDDDILDDVDLYDNEVEHLNKMNTKLQGIQETEIDIYEQRLTNATRHDHLHITRKSDSESDTDFDDESTNEDTNLTGIGTTEIAPSALSELPLAPPPKEHTHETDDSLSDMNEDTSHEHTDDDLYHVPHEVPASVLSELPMETPHNDSADTEDTLSHEDSQYHHEDSNDHQYATYDKMMSNLAITGPRDVAVSELSGLPMARTKKEDMNTEDHVNDHEMLDGLNAHFAPSRAPSDLALSALSELPMTRAMTGNNDSGSDDHLDTMLSPSDMGLSALSEWPIAPKNDSSDTMDTGSASDSTQSNEHAKRNTRQNEASVSGLTHRGMTQRDDGSLSSLLEKEDNHKNEESISDLQ